MTFPGGLYRTLEDIVGTENVTAEPVILDSYAFQLAAEHSPSGDGQRFGFRPGAVVLPSNTEEVQAIVKSCNRYKIKFKAHSTGWGAWGAPGSEGVVQLDLRRMNRILEINERNMYAVVEPYVIGAQLQAELMKRSLNCQIISAGSNCTAFAPGSLAGGAGWSSITTSQHMRNVLGVEWVLPTGEILKLGSLGSGAGWFSGDGPGPSLRGIMRGYFGSAGGVGVFTKAGIKVYHWPRPPVTSIEGISPSYRLKPPPDKKAFCLFFPSLEKIADAGNMIAESEIAFMLDKVPRQTIAWTFAVNNLEGVELLSKISEETKGQYGALLVVLSANSSREFDYQEKVLKQIVSEKEGKFLSITDDPEIQAYFMWQFIRVSSGSKQHVRPAGGLTNPFVAPDTWDYAVNIIETGHEFENKYIQKHQIVDTGADSFIGHFAENGHFQHMEANSMYDPIDPESVAAAGELKKESTKLSLVKWGAVGTARGDAGHDVLGPLVGDYHLWQRKIKKMLDPNLVADASYYITPK